MTQKLGQFKKIYHCVNMEGKTVNMQGFASSLKAQDLAILKASYLLK